MTGQRPAGLPVSAHQLWDEGVGNARIRSGDLWVLSWDGETVGVALVVAVKRGFVHAWPVTLPGETSFAPGLILDVSPLGLPVTLWPTRGTGIGNHMLDRSLGRLLEPERVREIAEALDSDEDPGFPFADGFAGDEANNEADEAFVDLWTELCLNDGGVEDGVFLDRDRVAQAGGNSRTVGEVLGVDAQGVRPLLVGTEPVTVQQLAAVAERLSVDPESLTRDDPLADVVADLALPVYKRAIVARVRSTGERESAIRRSSRREFALAARNDSDALRETKLRDAISRAGRDER